jgi:hypothetical protein
MAVFSPHEVLTLPRLKPYDGFALWLPQSGAS